MFQRWFSNDIAFIIVLDLSWLRFCRLFRQVIQYFENIVIYICKPQKDRKIFHLKMMLQGTKLIYTSNTYWMLLE